MPTVTNLRTAYAFEGDPKAPQFAAYVNGAKLGEEITRHVLSVRYEESVEMASMLNIVLDNSYHRFTDTPLFSPGVEIDVWMGYGNDLSFLGRVQLQKHLPTFPETGVPVLELVGYDPLVRMNHNEATTGDDTQRREKNKQGQIYKGTVGTVVSEIYAKYGAIPVVAATFMTKPLPGAVPGEVGHTYRKADTTDAEFLRALANICGAEMFLRYELMGGSQLRVPSYLARRSGGAGSTALAMPGQWKGHWRLPQQTAIDAYVNFRYGAGDESTVIHMELEFAITGRVTEVTVMFKNKVTGYYEAVTEEKERARTTPRYKTTKTKVKAKLPSGAVDEISKKREARQAETGKKITGPFTAEEVAPYEGMGIKDKIALNRKYGKSQDATRMRTVTTTTKVKTRDALPGTFDERGPAAVQSYQGSDGEVTDYSPLRILAGGFSFDVNPGKKFRTVQEAIEFAKRWFEKYRDSLIIGRGTVIGYEKLKAGTVHKIHGIGDRYSGDYYFVTVEHEFDSAGYRTHFTARKVLS